MYQERDSSTRWVMMFISLSGLSFYTCYFQKGEILLKKKMEIASHILPLPAYFQDLIKTITEDFPVEFHPLYPKDFI